MKMMYYPFVHPPRPVLWQALLYWDELTSISPEDGYKFRHDLVVLRDLGLYQPTHADDLPARARADLVSDLRQVVEELPGEDLVPVPGPLGPDNRVYWGKLPYEVEHDLVEIGALVPQEDMLRASPVLLSRLMVVLAKHLAAAARGVIPFTNSPSANQVAFAPLGPDLRHRRCWQLQIGHLLPIPASDVSLTKVLEFRDAYTMKGKNSPEQCASSCCPCRNQATKPTRLRYSSKSRKRYCGWSGPVMAAASSGWNEACGPSPVWEPQPRGRARCPSTTGCSPP